MYDAFFILIHYEYSRYHTKYCRHFIVVLNLIKSHCTIIPSGVSYLSAVKCSVYKKITKVATIITIKPLTISCAEESEQVPRALLGGFDLMQTGSRSDGL